MFGFSCINGEENIARILVWKLNRDGLSCWVDMQWLWPCRFHIHPLVVVPLKSSSIAVSVALCWGRFVLYFLLVCVKEWKFSDFSNVVYGGNGGIYRWREEKIPRKERRYFEIIFWKSNSLLWHIAGSSSKYHPNIRLYFLPCCGFIIWKTILIKAPKMWK